MSDKINKWPNLESRQHNLWMAARTLRTEYAKRLALYELELFGNNGTSSREVEDEELAQIREYSISTAHRRNFMMRCIVANLDNNYIEVGHTIELLGCSRAAMDTMIKECLEANWLTQKKNKQGYRRIQAADVVVDCWLGYADYVTELANSYDLNYLGTSAKKIRHLLDTK